jgi:hypothetical protein
MGIGMSGKVINENLVAVDSEVEASQMPDRTKIGKSLVTLKDRALFNIALAKQGSDKITKPTKWRYEETISDEIDPSSKDTC